MRKRIQQFEGRSLSKREFRLLQGILTTHYSHMEEERRRKLMLKSELKTFKKNNTVKPMFMKRPAAKKA